MPGRAYGDYAQRFYQGMAGAQARRGEYDRAAQTLTGRDDERAAAYRDEGERVDQRNFEREYTQAFNNNEFNRAGKIAAQRGNIQGVTAARTGQQEYSEQQRTNAWRQLGSYVTELEDIEQMPEAERQSAWTAFVGRARAEAQGDGASVVNQLPDQYNPALIGRLRTRLTSVRNSLLTPEQQAAAEQRREERENGGWQLDAYGRPYQLRGGVVSRRNESGEIVPDNAPVPVPRDRVPAPQTYGPEGLSADQVRAEREFARDWRAVYNNFAEIRDSWQRIQTSAAQGNSAGDLALVVGFTKLLDPGSVAREGEVALTQSAASLLAQAQNFLPRLQEGNTLLPAQVRQQLLTVAREMYGNYDTAYNRLAADYGATADNYGFDRSRVMMGYTPPPEQPPRTGGGGGIADSGARASVSEADYNRAAELQRQLDAIDAELARLGGGQ